VRIGELFWNDNNVDHLAERHHVNVEEVEEIVYGIDDERTTFRIKREGDFYVIFGETGHGRLLKLVGEFLEDRHFRVFAARDMDDREKRAYRKG
jgi:uncharacterized DUF497 family protein